jgi:CDP-glucose 4,6-dehydratase
MPRAAFWKGRRVFITGHTGFKGSWLCLWLDRLGAHITGYALNPPTRPSLFELSGVAKRIHSIHGDVRDAERLKKCLRAARPEVVIHMAAQPLVRESYKHPLETFSTNVLGTAHFLDAVRHAPSVRAAVVVTTDKCYEDRGSKRGYREGEPLGGYDPYSSSKACAEMVTSAYRNSFFNPAQYGKTHRTAVASARAGNVIGGGDWARDRLLPDAMRALLGRREIRIRHPRDVRAWQHVLEPLSGYLTLAEKLSANGAAFAEAWNFGPRNRDAKSVQWMATLACSLWGDAAAFRIEPGQHPHETEVLKLDSSKARKRLGWAPRWPVQQAVEKTLDWYRAYGKKDDLRALCLEQIKAYEATPLLGNR